MICKKEAFFIILSILIVFAFLCVNQQTAYATDWIKGDLVSGLSIGTAGRTRLVFDEDGEPHIFYNQSDDLSHIYRDSSGWQSTEELISSDLAYFELYRVTSESFHISYFNKINA